MYYVRLIEFNKKNQSIFKGVKLYIFRIRSIM